MADKEALYDEGTDLAFEGKYAEAIARYEEALRLDPGYADAVHAIMMAYKELEDLDRAIEWGKRLVELIPDDILAHTSLSTVYQMKGLIPEAEAEGARAKMLDWKRQIREQQESKPGGGGQDGGTSGGPPDGTGG